MIIARSSEPTVGRRRAFGSVMLSLFGLVSCSSGCGVGGPWSAAELVGDARMAVIYEPAVGECAPAEIQLLRALHGLGEKYPDIRVLTMLPVGAEVEDRYGVPFPGEVRTRSGMSRTRARLGPPPRIEVWSAAGELLLLRSIPRLGAQADLVIEEIEWSRSFTAPPSRANPSEPSLDLSGTSSSRSR